jgi:hypothetical protein
MVAAAVYAVAATVYARCRIRVVLWMLLSSMLIGDRYLLHAVLLFTMHHNPSPRRLTVCSYGRL